MRVDHRLNALEFTVSAVHTLQSITTDMFTMFPALKLHDALISLHVDGRTKQSVLEVVATHHSLGASSSSS